MYHYRMSYRETHVWILFKKNNHTDSGFHSRLNVVSYEYHIAGRGSSWGSTDMTGLLSSQLTSSKRFKTFLYMMLLSSVCMPHSQHNDLLWMGLCINILQSEQSIVNLSLPLWNKPRSFLSIIWQAIDAWI